MKLIWKILLTSFICVIAIIFTYQDIFYSLANKNPDKAKIITSDIDNFWQAFDKKSNLKEDLEKIYFSNASSGLNDFIDERIGGFYLLLTLIWEWDKIYLKLSN